MGTVTVSIKVCGSCSACNHDSACLQFQHQVSHGSSHGHSQYCYLSTTHTKSGSIYVTVIPFTKG